MPDDPSDNESAIEQGQRGLIVSLAVSDLFGRHNYTLPVPGESASDRLVLFYGDNGSGKTTVLRMLWHLLSPSNNRRHRASLREIPFRRFEVVLSEGATLVAEKARGLVGAFSITLQRGLDTVVSHWGAPESEGSPFAGWDPSDIANSMDNFPDELRKQAENALAQHHFLKFLADLGVKPFYLADDRNIYSDELDDDPRATAEIARADLARRRQIQRGGPDEVQGIVAQELDVSMRRASELLQQLALGGATSGSAGANSVYLDVLQRLNAPALHSADSPEHLRSELIAGVRELGSRSEQFEELGLVPRLGATDFVQTLTSLPNDRVPIAHEVLRPYINSLTARLDALQDAQSLIRTFLDQANRFLTDKELTFAPRHGLRIRLLEDDEWLRPAALSSGERQLILLLCNALLARRGTRLFLIDEPELSLNAKWQRMIGSALLACTAGSPVQFVIATHSIEMLTAFRSNIVRLDDETSVGAE